MEKFLRLNDELESIQLNDLAEIDEADQTKVMIAIEDLQFLICNMIKKSQ